MGQSQAKEVLVRGLRKIVERRNYRGWWAHIVWVLAYTAFILLMLGNLGAQDLGDLLHAWFLFIPLGFVIIQWIRPTLIGWALINLPGVGYILAVVVWLVWCTVAPPSWYSPPNPSEWLYGLLFLGFLAALQAGILYAGWPGPKD